MDKQKRSLDKTPIEMLELKKEAEQEKLALSDQDLVNLDESPVTGITLRRILVGHTGDIMRIAWSKDGKILASPSSDKTVRIWDAESWDCLATLNHEDSVHCVAWSPDGHWLASAGMDKKIYIWNAASWQIQAILNEHNDEIWALAWSHDGSKLASGDRIGEIFIWDSNWNKSESFVANSNTFIYELSWLHDISSKMLSVSFINSRLFQIWSLDHDLAKLILSSEFPLDHVYGLVQSPQRGLIAVANYTYIRILNDKSYSFTNNMEGHTDQIRNVSISSDGNILATKSMDNTVRLWKLDIFQEIARLSESDTYTLGGGIAFHPNRPILATLGNKNKSVRIWELNYDILLARHVSEFIRYISAKIVLVGESHIGKSCLAMRLAEDRYPKDSEQGTTHGMRFWPVQPAIFGSKTASSEGERRDIVLWDLGGQSEYRLVHQLFLHDTTLALFLFDPTRGEVAFDEVKAWNMRLEKQLHGRKAAKFLIGSKMDAPSSLINKNSIERLIKDHDFIGYYETSAITGRGIPELRDAIADALDWGSLSKTSRPELFQRIRDEIDSNRKAGNVVLYLNDLNIRIHKHFSRFFDPDAIEAVAEQLAKQGIIAVTSIVSGEKVLILQIGEIERYAGSLIVAARESPRGVPVLEERDLISPDHMMPGIEEQDRLRRDQERVVLESVVELLIQNGICFRSQGLLVFPTLFPEIEADASGKLAHSISLFYDFTGAIDNIYASLVAWLVIGEKFGSPRLWANRVEFDEPNQGICGMRQIKYRSGLSHLDLYFAETTIQERRNFFTRFIEDHLRRHGVEVREHQAINCGGCGYEISEEIVHENIAREQKDVICPKCRKLTLISEGVEAIRKRDPESDQKVVALRTEIEKRTRHEVEAVKKVMAAGSETTIPRDKPIIILHLSDLHFDGDTSPQSRLQWLIEDITKGECLGIETIEYLVISGDMTDKGNEAGFEKAREFVQLLTERFGLSAQRCIFVPGNHDVQDLEESFDLCFKVDGLNPEQYVKQGEVYLVRNNEKYKLRMKKFSEAFFHKVVQQPYPLDYSAQGIPYLFPDTRIQFVTLNSCWQIDRFNRKRAGIHMDAVAHVIQEAEKQVKDAIKAGQLDKGDRVLRIGVWHHAVAGHEMMANTDFIEHLQNNNVKICMHGDVHEQRRELLKYWHPLKMDIIGAGSFGSPPEGRPESTACLYNLLELTHDLTSVRVHTRCQSKTDGTWKGWYEWPRSDAQSGRLPYYDLQLV